MLGHFSTFSVPNLPETVLNPKLPTGHEELGKGGLAHTHSRCSSGVLEQRYQMLPVTGSIPWVCLVGRVARFHL